ncbi:MAG: dipeptidase [Candidatus Marinimicrobia bacterium]|nr:dipeptidase [Candidatus Neomarinimicrobiota bacterium]
MNLNDAIAFHKSILTIDTHVDTPLPIKREPIDLGQRYDPFFYKSKLDLPRMDAGGLDAAFFAVWTPQGLRNDSAHAAIKQSALDIIEDIHRSVNPYPKRARLAFNSGDAEKFQEQGIHAIYMGLENGYPIGTDLANLDLFYEKGIRYMTLCHTKNNEICDSSTDSSEYGGLSPFGYEVVERMNDLGMMVDVSHLSDAAVEDVLNVSRAPIIASHSCAQALCDHPRNINDDLLKKIAMNGGVIQLCILTDYVRTPADNPLRDSARAALKEKWGDMEFLSEADKDIYRQERYKINQDFPLILPTVADAVNHIDHMVQIAGIDHVGIGSDFDGGGALSDCYDVSEIPNITFELLKRGYSKIDIEKIWSGNILRVFEAVEKLKINS